MTWAEDARAVIVQYQTSSVEWQRENRSAIIEAFRIFWTGHPTEEEFATTMRRIVLFPEILYIMVKGQ